MEKLSKVHNISLFDCGDEDINDFLKNDALRWQRKNIATTFIFIYYEEVIGFFCCSGDAIKLKTSEKKEGELNSKHIKEFPAIKIGRLGRDKKYGKEKIGSKILKWALGYVKEMSEKIGVRFVTVDAYPHKVKWYESFGFVRNLHEQYNEKTNVSMRYDLTYNPPQTK